MLTSLIKVKKKPTKTYSLDKKFNKLLKKKIKIKQKTIFPRLKTKLPLCLKVRNITKKRKNTKYKRYKKYLKLNLNLKKTNKKNNNPKQTFISIFEYKKPLKTRKIRHKKNSIEILTKSKQSFVLKSPIMFFKQFFLKNSLKTSLKKFIFKKTIFSFFKTNEVRRNLMNLKKKFFIYNLVFKEKILRKQGLHFSPSKLKQIYKNNMYYNLANYKLKTTSTFETSQHIFALKTKSLNITSKDVFNLKGLDFTLKRPEVKIPRVKFKPGYKRL